MRGSLLADREIKGDRKRKREDLEGELFVGRGRPLQRRKEYRGWAVTHACGVYVFCCALWCGLTQGLKLIVYIFYWALWDKRSQAIIACVVKARETVVGARLWELVQEFNDWCKPGDLLHPSYCLWIILGPNPWALWMMLRNLSSTSLC